MTIVGKSPAALRCRELREEVYRAFLTRASGGDIDNTPVIDRILEARDEQAKLLGLSCFADKSMASKVRRCSLQLRPAHRWSIDSTSLATASEVLRTMSNAILAQQSANQWAGSSRRRCAVLVLSPHRCVLKTLPINQAASLPILQMATLDKAEALLEELRAASWNSAVRDLSEVQAFAREHGFDGELRQWDVSFWAERLREERYAITNEQLRPYFALPAVLDGLFAVRLLYPDKRPYATDTLLSWFGSSHWVTLA